MNEPIKQAVPHMTMEIREISEIDFDVVVELLCEGFAKRNGVYWRRALHYLKARPTVDGYPKYGYLLIVNSRPGGVLLLLTSQTDGQVISNLSSWYVREDCRKFSVFMFQRAIRKKGGCYLNISPSPVALPIATALGFLPYSQGSLLVLPSALLAQSKSDVKRLEGAQVEFLPDVVKTNMGYGCKGFWIRDEQGEFPALYIVERFKKIPTARFVYGDPTRVIGAAPPLIRRLLPSGVYLILVDAPASLAPTGWSRLLPERGRRYYKGEKPPEVGNLLETELSVFSS